MLIWYPIIYETLITHLGLVVGIITVGIGAVGIETFPQNWWRPLVQKFHYSFDHLQKKGRSIHYRFSLLQVDWQGLPATVNHVSASDECKHRYRLQNKYNLLTTSQWWYEDAVSSATSVSVFSTHQLRPETCWYLDKNTCICSVINRHLFTNKNQHDLDIGNRLVPRESRILISKAAECRKYENTSQPITPRLEKQEYHT